MSIVNGNGKNLGNRNATPTRGENAALSRQEKRAQGKSPKTNGKGNAPLVPTPKKGEPIITITTVRFDFLANKCVNRGRAGAVDIFFVLR